MKLKIRNGYRIGVTFDREMRRFVGMHDLFSDFGLKGGEILLFEIVNRGTLNVFIVGEHLGEIQYPSVVHLSQNRSPSPCKFSFLLLYVTCFKMCSIIFKCAKLAFVLDISVREDWHMVHLFVMEKILLMN